VTAIGLYIAFYYGLTGFACAWYYRRTLLSSQRNLWMQGILPALGGLTMYGAGGWSLWADWDVATGNSFTSWLMPFWPHWYIGGVFVIAFLSALAGFIVGIIMRFVRPAYFRKWEPPSEGEHMDVEGNQDSWLPSAAIMSGDPSPWCQKAF
jgi:hypothetical protein